MNNKTTRADVTLFLANTVCLLTALLAVLPTNNIALMIVLILVMLVNLAFAGARFFTKAGTQDTHEKNA
ncbi:hypothetical protein [Bifidobacterium pseudolongum]|uniref:Uncharacterized protein n=1 Tax=Bifidobacterium pseudolongum subsp. globosum TaxID=1690 RepID=A0A2N3R4P2_9BIFI|nr:hypothetical protein [Bifidobacterium pseudolongum]PKV03592.1 hypothetical protein CQR50_1300 [Bifidobacterium pseudolongum subsp. globosum]